MANKEHVQPSIAQLEERGTVICKPSLCAIPRSLVRTRLEGYFSYCPTDIAEPNQPITVSEWYSIQVVLQRHTRLNHKYD